MKTLFLISSLILSLACENVNDKMYGDTNADFEEIMDIPSTMQAPPPPQKGSEIIDKKIIKTGGIDFQSDNVEHDYNSIRQLLPKYNAYIENENQSKSTNRINYNLIIRVPSSYYDTLFNSLSNLATRLDSKYSNVEDVTERYYDLKTRIKNKKVLEQRYLDLLDRASNVKDILEIEKNLNEVRTDVERLEGQFKYLSKQVNFSTIHVSFYEVLPYKYDASQRKGFGARILSSLNNGWQGFLSFVIGLLSLWPFIILLAGGIYIFKKMNFWRKTKK